MTSFTAYMKARAEWETARALNLMAIRDIAAKTAEDLYKKDPSSGAYWVEDAAKKAVAAK